ncbi:MAG: type III secretion system chaperone [Waddliaceae bacterium]
MLDDMIDALKSELDTEIPTEVPGVWTLLLDDGEVVTITSVPQGFYLECRFGGYPDEKQLSFFTHALHANLYCEGTEDCVLGIDEDDKTLVLSEVIEVNVDYAAFKEILEKFINSIDFWKEEAQSFV